MGGIAGTCELHDIFSILEKEGWNIHIFVPLVDEGCCIGRQWHGLNDPFVSSINKVKYSAGWLRGHE